VRLVEDDRVVLGQDADAVAALAHAEVGEVERVIHDHEVGVRGPLPGRLREAGADVSARPAETAVRAHSELAPQPGRRLDVELGPVARLGRVDPRPHGVERLPVLGAGEERSAEQHKPLQAVPAQVVLPPLEDGDVHVAAQRRRRERHVLRQQLLLQSLGRGGDDDPAARGERGRKVGEALPRARAGLGEQVPPFLERQRDRIRERGLLLPRLVLLEHLPKRSAAAEDVAHSLELRGRGGRTEKMRSERLFSLRHHLTTSRSPS
jgi:hypothetical protein